MHKNIIYICCCYCVIDQTIKMYQILGHFCESLYVKWIFSKGCILLSHVQNWLLVQSTLLLMCIGNWSKLGFIQAKDVTAAISSSVIGEEEMLRMDGTILMSRISVFLVQIRMGCCCLF